MPRDRRWEEAAMIALVLLLAVASCGPTATPTLVPTPTAEPEVLAAKNDDVVGKWLMISSSSDTMHPAKWHIEHTVEGARNYTIVYGAYSGTKGEGKFWFEGGLYKVQIFADSTEANSGSIGTYQVHVTRQGGKAVQLRFVVVDDPYVERKNRLTYKPLTRVGP